MLQHVCAYITWGCVDVLLYSTGLEDFVLGSNGAIVLMALGATQCINVTVVNDDVREPDEMVVLKAEPQNPRDEVIGIGEFTIVIMDDGDGEYIE